MSPFLIRLKNSLPPQVRRQLSRFMSLFRIGPDDFLRDVTGVVHVGANTGQERDKYARHGLSVIWVEPIPDIYAELVKNIQGYDRQRALQALITDGDNHPHVFHIANNRGESSSIFDLKEHSAVWPEVRYESQITLNSITLPSLFRRERIDASHYQAWILDTQGAELLVLRGSIPLVKGLKYIKTEVSDFDAYAGGCQLPEILEFMTQHGFREHYRKRFARGPQGGGCYDIIFKRVDAAG